MAPATGAHFAKDATQEQKFYLDRFAGQHRAADANKICWRGDDTAGLTRRLHRNHGGDRASVPNRRIGF